MSKMKELYLKVAADAGLQEKANKIFETTEDAAVTVTKLVEFAKEQGYEVTVEEVKEFFKSQSEKSSGELDDDELESVAGGKVRPGGGGISLSYSGPFVFGMCGIPMNSATMNCRILF